MTSSRTAAKRHRSRAIRQASRATTGRGAATGLATPSSSRDTPESPETLTVSESATAHGGIGTGRANQASRRWPWLAGTLICLLGLADASYLTVAHYDAHVTLACPDRGFVNCGLVTTSVYSEILGIPVAVLGLVFFLGMLPLQLPWAWRSTRRSVRLLRLGGSVVGVGMVMWLVYAELFLIGSICLYCTGVHVLTFLLFVTVAFGTAVTSPEPTG